MPVRPKKHLHDSVQTPKAVVVGLCAHGLSIARDLHSAGVDVIALEADRTLPGVFTRCADVKFVSDINSQGLVDVLLDLAKSSGFYVKPVLFLTNDRMVEIVGNAIALIGCYYNLSWANNVSSVLPLLDKRNIEARCLEKGLNYPKSVLIVNCDCFLSEMSKLKFPVILKPTRPLSRFKTLVLDSNDSLLESMAVVESSMPVLAQEFIPGDDSSIYFCAFVLKNGDVYSRFDGRKLRSRPMGHTTVAIPEENEVAFNISKHFFDGLGISGPVSLELKKDTNGAYWVIEPTVGRTDFWVGICSVNGVNLPFVEFQMAIGGDSSLSIQCKKILWVNEDRDPGVLFWLLFKYPFYFFRYGFKGVYVSTSEIGLTLVFVARYLERLLSRALGKLLRIIRR